MPSRTSQPSLDEVVSLDHVPAVDEILLAIESYKHAIRATDEWRPLAAYIRLLCLASVKGAKEGRI